MHLFRSCRFTRALLGLTIVCLAASCFGDQTSSFSKLKKGFQRPPASARPWVFWFWLNGNETSNSITADLEAIRRVGLGGVLIMEVDQGTPAGPVQFASREWLNLFKHTCSEAHRLGLSVSMNDDAGWSGSGGPWITPELSMQKVVWTEITVTGPGRRTIELPQPQAFANYYRDIAVLAVPEVGGEGVSMRDAQPKWAASGVQGDFIPSRLLDGDPQTLVMFSKPEPGRSHYLALEFPQPFAARRLKLSTPGLNAHTACQVNLEWSEDGTNYTELCEFHAESAETSQNFKLTSARFFRLRFSNPSWYLDRLPVADVDLSPAFRIDDIERKALFMARKEFESRCVGAKDTTQSTLPQKQVVDVTAQVNPTGRLVWDVPEGRWTIMRFGHTSTGADNLPAPKSGQGLECDKLNRRGAEAAFNGFIGRLASEVGPLAGTSFVGTHIDSWEVGSQNWTEGLQDEFRRRRGYDPLPWLPVLSGRVLENLEVSERFLWDWRQTISELIAENYSGHFSELARRHGLSLSIEAYDLNPCDDLPYGGRCSQPTAEFWVWPPYALRFSCMEMASAAHVYGRQIAGAEAFTCTDVEKWLGHPYLIKPFGDYAFCQGVNRFIIHRYAMQPTEPTRYPGSAMGPWGLHYERTQTWWEQSKTWIEYLTRCQYLLQQGSFVADICYLAAEDPPQRWLAPGSLKERPGYNFDACPAEVVIEKMSVSNGRLTLPGGASYRALVLPETKTMTLGLLRRLKALVEAGATVIGPRPERSPSLQDFPACDTEVHRLASELWGQCDGLRVKENKFGRGRVFWGLRPEEIFVAEGVPPDFEARAVRTTTSRGSIRQAPEAVRFTHRLVGETDIYFIANRETLPLEAECFFRVEGKSPEFWWPDTGRVEKPGVYNAEQGRIRVPLRLDPSGSLFVIFPHASKLNPERIVAVERNGVAVAGAGVAGSDLRVPGLVSTNNENALSETFTVGVWVKPAVQIDIPEETGTGIAGSHVFRNDAPYPPSGDELFGGATDAVAGMSFGENGVCVFEHGGNYFASVLVQPASITNWTHAVIVYRENRPSLYLNGRFQQEGLQSQYKVHSGVGLKHNNGVAPFRGSLGEYRTFDRALSPDEIRSLMAEMPVPPDPLTLPAVDVIAAKGREPQVAAWTPGTYQLRSASGRTATVRVPDGLAGLALEGPWEVTFPPGWGAPARVSFARLQSWSDHEDPGIRFFSGTARYRKVFTVPKDLKNRNRRFFLDLGEVAVMAEPRLNGVALGTLWKPPFRVEVTRLLKEGENVLEVAVVNLWPNRMIGDERLPEDSPRSTNGTMSEWPDWIKEGKPSPTGRFTFTTWRLWKKDAPLQKSGLLGPVQLVPARIFRPQ